MARARGAATTETCQFCQVVRGETPSHAVFEDEVAIAFLDRRPLFPGHCLLIPRIHYPTLAELPEELIPVLFSDVWLIAQAVEEGMEAEGTFVAINNRVSQSVPHLHIHIVPRRKKDGLKGFFWPRQRYKDEEALRQAQKAIRSAITRLRSKAKTD